MASATLESHVGYTPQGLTFERYFSHEGTSPLDEVTYETRTSELRDPVTKERLFYLEGIEAPTSWSQNATDVAAQKYFRMPNAGVETSVRQMVSRVANTISQAGEDRGYFATKQDAAVFRDELTSLLINQKMAFNSPVWFNVGLKEAYGIEGKAGGNWAYDVEAGEVTQTNDSYSRPQASACFIQSVEDDLMSIFDLAKNEARLFKYGSGTGTNFSSLRGVREPLGPGGSSSGTLSFLDVLNAGAGATKSGGTTRRAAKMVCLDYDHPEIMDFINWKLEGEQVQRIFKAVIKNPGILGEEGPAVVKYLQQQGWDGDFNAKLTQMAPGQNSNNSIRIPDEVMEHLDDPNYVIKTTNRTDGTVRAEIPVQEFWKELVNAAWECADPGVQFDTTINEWNPCSNSDRIRASNPCSEYMFLDDSACNLASINLVQFLGEDGRFDVEAYKKAVQITFTAQEILVGHSSFPTRKIAENSENFRPIGIGYANLGALAMRMGFPYDSDQAESLTGSLTAILTGESAAQSARIAGTHIGPFAKYMENQEPFLNVIGMHRDASRRIKNVEGLEYLMDVAQDSWDVAETIGRQNGFRNAQLSVLAPTGTIGLLMDCDTLGIEPDFSLTKLKTLAGKGKMTILNQSVSPALRRLGYSQDQIDEVSTYVIGHKTADGAPHLRDEDQAEVGNAKEFDRLGLLNEKGYSQEEIEGILTYIDGFQTIEGAPHVREEHYAVFDSANRPFRGERFIAPEGHLRIMAAAQPFLSGAISKTVNLPHDATREDVSMIYRKGWEMGLKALALYRDGSKGSQPLEVGGKLEQALLEDPTDGVDPMLWGDKRRLADLREGLNMKLEVGGHIAYLKTGEYEDGSLGEVFVTASKEGSHLRTTMDAFSVAVSKGLQHGWPLPNMVETYVATQSDVKGLVTGYPHVKTATSLNDAVFRVLGIEYLGRTELATMPENVDLAQTRAEVLKRRKVADELYERLLAGGQVTLEGANGSNGNAHQSRAKTPRKRSAPQSDAGPCPKCGSMMQRIGSCPQCPACGHGAGCGGG